MSLVVGARWDLSGLLWRLLRLGKVLLVVVGGGSNGRSPVLLGGQVEGRSIGRSPVPLSRRMRGRLVGCYSAPLGGQVGRGLVECAVLLES